MPNGCFCLAPPRAGGRDASLRAGGGEGVVPGAQGGLGLGPFCPSLLCQGLRSAGSPNPGSWLWLLPLFPLIPFREEVGGGELPCLVASKLLSSSISDNSRLHSGRGSCADRPQNQTDSHRSAAKTRAHTQCQSPRGVMQTEPRGQLPGDRSSVTQTPPLPPLPWGFAGWR